MHMPPILALLHVALHLQTSNSVKSVASSSAANREDSFFFFFKDSPDKLMSAHQGLNYKS